jgi:F-type H+-transporting ATPase subunit a
MALFMIAIFLFVGIIEVISISFRPVSLSFRLYGNIFAGENILESMMHLVPWLGWLLPLPFYFLELLVGLVQALVFALLTSVFTALMAGHHDDSHSKGHAHAH